MTERLNVFRVAADEVQGEGSFVRLRRLAWDRRQEAQRLLAEAAGGTLPNDPTQVLVTSQFLATNEDYTRRMLRECVVEWNWVDEQGQPLPLPRDLPEGSLGDLSEAEVGFIIRALQVQPGELKNSGNGSPSTSGRVVNRRRNTRT